MAVTDDERREVAQRLREIQADVISGTKTEAHPIAGRIIGVACGYDLPDFQGLLSRLADLIEPIERACYYYDAETNHCRCYDTRLVDRDALLALADEMDEVAQRRRSMGYEGFAIGDEDRARRIREALGMES